MLDTSQDISVQICPVAAACLIPGLREESSSADFSAVGCPGFSLDALAACAEPIPATASAPKGSTSSEASGSPGFHT